MQYRACFRGLTVALTLAAGLSACTTPHLKGAPSRAVLDARAAAGAKPVACKTGGLDTLSPVDAEFPFDSVEISPLGETRLAAAAHWLACNPGVEAVIIPNGDSHGDAAHLNALAQSRAEAVVGRLRALGATDATLRILARGGADPLTTAHLVINASGRGW